jgi:hypothetical protein
MEPEDCLPLDPTMNQINPVNALQSHFLMIYFNNILPPTPRSSKWPLSIRFPTTVQCAFLFSTSHATLTAHLILLDFISLKTLNYTCTVYWTHLNSLPLRSLSSEKVRCCWWSHCLAQWHHTQFVHTEDACFLCEQPEICSLQTDKRNARITALHVNVSAQC